MWKQLIAKESSSAAKEVRVAEPPVTLACRAKEASMDGDAGVDAGQGSVATGHCLLRVKAGAGLCTISDGTGTLAGFRARVRVTAGSSIANLWHWDGTYSFSQG